MLYYPTLSCLMLDYSKLYFYFGFSIYQVHDELKDKDFRYEMGIVGRETNGIHLINPENWTRVAVEAGEAAKNADDSENEM